MKMLLMMSFLIGLTACTTKTEYRYVKPVIPELPPKPAYADVEWKKYEFDDGTHYCLDRENAKRLLINEELERAYTQKLEQILQMLRDRYGRSERDS